MKRPNVLRSFNTSDFLSRHRLALTAALMVFSAVLMLTISNAKAEEIKYTLNPNPLSYQDIINTDNTDYLSGDITVSSTGDPFGTWTSSNLPATYEITLSFNLTMSSSDKSIDPVTGTRSYTLSDMFISGALQGSMIIAPEGISLTPNTNQLAVDLNASDDYSPPYVAGWWAPSSDVVNFYSGPGGGKAANMQFNHSASDVYGSDSWTIAIPEPATLSRCCARHCLDLE